MKEENKAAAAIVAVGVVVTGVALNYINVVRIERKKRAKIKAWEAENHACIERSKERLLMEIDKENFNTNDFLDQLEVERKFLKIVRDQPMY